MKTNVKATLNKYREGASLSSVCAARRVPQTWWGHGEALQHGGATDIRMRDTRGHVQRSLKSSRRLLVTFIAACAPHLLGASAASAAEPVNEALRIHVEGRHVLGEADLQARKYSDTASAMAEFRKNIVSIHRDASVRLTVETISPQGRATVVTDNAATTFHSLSPSRLSVSVDGVVTASPATDAPLGGSGDVAVLIVFEKGAQQAWNKVFFKVIP